MVFVVLIAAGTNIFKRADVQIAAPKIRFAGKTEARNPPGIWVIFKEIKKNENDMSNVVVSYRLLKVVV